MSSFLVANVARKYSKSVFSGFWRENFHFQTRVCTSAITKRCFSLSSRSLANLEVEKQDGFGIITMQRKPVNALNTEMITRLCEAIKEVETDKSCQGLILTSAIPKIFSGGLDITGFLGDKESLANFWYSFQELWLTLYGSRLATVAAINGAAPAGGLLLAISCDYRIMLDGFVVGPNETHLGIVAPPWFQDTLINTVGLRKTEHLLGLGQLLKSKQALEVGLIDSVVKENILDVAKNELKKWLAIPAEARMKTKLMLRAPILEKLRKGRDEDLRHFMEFCTKDSTQKVIAGYLAKLGKK